MVASTRVVVSAAELTSRMLSLTLTLSQQNVACDMAIQRELASHGVPCVRSALPSTRVVSSVLDTAKMRALSAYARSSGTTLPALAELLRKQTADYRPNKALIPAAMARSCTGYSHLNETLCIAAEGGPRGGNANGAPGGGPRKGNIARLATQQMDWFAVLPS